MSKYKSLYTISHFENSHANQFIRDTAKVANVHAIMTPSQGEPALPPIPGQGRQAAQVQEIPWACSPYLGCPRPAANLQSVVLTQWFIDWASVLRNTHMDSFQEGAPVAISSSHASGTPNTLKFKSSSGSSLTSWILSRRNLVCLRECTHWHQ